MLPRTAILAMGAILLGCNAPATSPNRGGSRGGGFRVGYQVIDLADGARRLTLAIWYPTEAEPESHAYGGGPVEGKLAVDAPLLEGRFPLFVFSHGYGGSGIGAVYLTEALAARGWIVAAPDHEDRDKAARIRTGAPEIDAFGYARRAREIAASGRAFDRQAYAYRLDDLRLVLDRMTGSAPWSRLVDRERVAAGGHSLGGFTALACAGAIAGRRDERIRAVLLLSPGFFMFDGEEFAAVRVPTMTMFGESEADEPRAGTTKRGFAEAAYDRLPAPKYLLEVKGATHFAFNERSSRRFFSRWLAGTPEQHAVVRRYAIAFLEKHVLGDEAAGPVLEGSDPLLSRHRREVARAE